MTTNPREVLRATADYLDANGKCEGSYYITESLTTLQLDQACVLGAMMRVLDLDIRQFQFLTNLMQASPEMRAATSLLSDNLQEFHPIPDGYDISVVDPNPWWSIITQWSDGTPETEVISTLRDLSKEPE